MKFTDEKRKKDIWMKFSANWNDRKEPNLKPYKIMFKGLHMKKHVRMLLVLQGHKIYSNNSYLVDEPSVCPKRGENGTLCLFNPYGKWPIYMIYDDLPV